MLAYCELKRFEKVDDSSDNPKALDDILSIRKEKTDTSRFFDKKKTKRKPKNYIATCQIRKPLNSALHPLHDIYNSD